MKWIAVLLAAGASLPAAGLSAAQWREDIAFLAQQLPARHPHLYFHLSQARFHREVARLSGAADTASDPEMRAGLVRLVASVGDAHTSIAALDPGGNFGMGFFEYPDGIYCSSARVELAEAMAARVIAVQGVPVAQLMDRLRPFVAPENKMAMLALTAPLLGRPEMLRAIGLPIQDNAADFLMERAGRRFTVHATVPAVRPTDVRRAPLDGAFPTPLYQSNRVDRYWFRYLEDGRTLYLQCNVCAEDAAQPFARFSAAVASSMEQHHPARIVVDLRHNGGGDAHLMDPLIAVLKGGHGARLFVIIGRGTMGAAFLAARDLAEQAHATRVGEPTGQKPNSYGAARTFTLPNSHLVVSCSTQYIPAMDHGDPPSYPPDRRIPMTSRDLQAGRDPVMAWITGDRR